MRAVRSGLGAALLAASMGAGAAEPVNPPRIDYMLHCQGCHAADGSGFPGAVPRLKGEVGKFLQVPGGREFLVQVPGVAQSMLEDAALARVLNWMVREFDPVHTPTDVVPYTAGEVSRLRAHKLVDVTSLRTQLLDLHAGPE
jgi:mono/diheme cytochrome c family protein